jgi:large subunit ribosomal protein L32e
MENKRNKVASGSSRLSSPKARKKPAFFRQGFNKMHKLGKKRSKKRVWRKAKGHDSVMRLKQRRAPAMPSIGWGSDKKIRGKIKGLEVVRVESLSQLEKIDKRCGILIGKIGKKKREEILEKAKEMKLTVLNRYKEKERLGTSSKPETSKGDSNATS